MKSQSASTDASRASRIVVALSLFSALLVAADVSGAVSASANNGLPDFETSHFIGGGGAVMITESVTLDLDFGPWLKHLINDSGQGFGSGDNVGIREFLTNEGTTPWTDWHEEVRSETIIDPNPNPQPGFLFRSSSVVLSANYGSGFVNLVSGLDYTLTPTVYSGPGIPGNNGNWSAVSIFFAPGREIGPGQILRIEKDIFEVFGDADPWRPGDEALVAQYPTPEPSGALLGTMGALAMCSRRRARV